MNYFLQLNKKIILTLIFTITLIIVFFLILQNIQLDVKNEKEGQKIIKTTYDVLKPKFTINNDKEKISVTANEGNFMNKNDILLKKNDLFKSKNFTIYSDNVLYNKKEQTANSDKDSVFVSDGTNIQSQGFNIIEQGNIIEFKGKSKIILSKWIN